MLRDNVVAMTKPPVHRGRKSHVWAQNFHDFCARDVQDCVYESGVSIAAVETTNGLHEWVCLRNKADLRVNRFFEPGVALHDQVDLRLRQMTAKPRISRGLGCLDVDEGHVTFCTLLDDIEPRPLEELVPGFEEDFDYIGGYYPLDGW